jgi:hypothetical protein
LNLAQHTSNKNNMATYSKGVKIGNYVEENALQRVTGVARYQGLMAKDPWTKEVRTLAP